MGVGSALVFGNLKHDRQAWASRPGLSGAGVLPFAGRMRGDSPSLRPHDRGMSDERPPDIDAEYRLIRGPWPRWALQLGLVKLAAWTAGVVIACLAVFLTVLFSLVG
jgi:hypothetical protein